MAKTFINLKTGRGEHSDSRSHQSKGKPSHTIAHGQVGRARSAGAPASVPNRSGGVKMNMPIAPTPVQRAKGHKVRSPLDG